MKQLLDGVKKYMETYNNRFKLSSITWPIIIQSFLNQLMGNINVLMLGHLSDKAVGAVGVANQIIGMLGITYTVISMGTIIIVTQYLGAEKPKQAKDVAQMSVCIGIILGLMFSIILLVFGGNLLKFMNLPKDMLPYGTEYIRIVGGISFLQAGIIIFSSILRSYGHTKLPMYVAVFMNIIIIIGNYLFLFKPFGIPVLGVKGVGISTAIGSLIGLAIVGISTYRELKVGFTLKYLRQFDIRIFKLILKVGGPAAGEYIFYSLSQIIVTYIVTYLGTVAINTRIYLQNITSFVNIISFSIGQGTQIIMGYMKGAGKVQDMHRTCIKSLKIAALSNFALAVVFYIFSKQLIGIYTTDTTILHMGKNILLVDMFLEIGRAFNHTVGSALRGTGDVRYPVIISICSMWGISVLLSFVLGVNLQLGLIGIWIASGLDEWFRGIILLRRWHSKKWLKINIL